MRNANQRTIVAADLSPCTCKRIEVQFRANAGRNVCEIDEKGRLRLGLCFRTVSGDWLNLIIVPVGNAKLGQMLCSIEASRLAVRM